MPDSWPNLLIQEEESLLLLTEPVRSIIGISAVIPDFTDPIAAFNEGS